MIVILVVYFNSIGYLIKSLHFNFLIRELALGVNRYNIFKTFFYCVHLFLGGYEGWGYSSMTSGGGGGAAGSGNRGHRGGQNYGGYGGF